MSYNLAVLIMVLVEIVAFKKNSDQDQLKIFLKIFLQFKEGIIIRLHSKAQQDI